MIRKALLFLPAAVLFCAFANTAAAQADSPQTPFERFMSRFDLSVQGAGMFTKTVTGPIVLHEAPDYGSTITQETSNTLGALVTLRYVQKPYVGLEANVSYARYTENFTLTPPGQIQTRADELTFGYLVTPPHKLFGLDPYLSAGVGTTEFKPTAHGGQGQLAQARLTYYYSAGLQYDLSEHFGLRAGWRQVFFMAPDFYANYLQIEKRTYTSEPTAGFYLRF